MGEGGALLMQDQEYIEKAEVLREKGTNRSRFFRGEIDKYTWVDFGDSYLPSELNAAYLWAQLQQADEINEDRMRSWNRYYKALKPLENAGKLELQKIPEGCVHNAHMFYVKLKNLEERTAFIAGMRERGVQCVFHYIPLHSAPAGKKFTLDSREPKGGYQEFLMNEARYSRLTREFPGRAEELFEQNERAAVDRYEHLVKLKELYADA